MELWLVFVSGIALGSLLGAGALLLYGEKVIREDAAIWTDDV